MRRPGPLGRRCSEDLSNLPLDSMKRFAIISLGCPRNLVDSELLAGAMKKLGFQAADVNDGVDLCVVNTCAFITPAREESVDTIMEIAALKKEGKVGRLVVCGCLPQLYKDKLSKTLPEADLILGTGDLPSFSRFIKTIMKGRKRLSISKRPTYLYNEDVPRLGLTPKHHVYVKVSEGCSNYCSYCIISRLRGVFRSRPIESIVNEARALARSGSLREINLIGQDTTLFGMDRYGTFALPRLLRKICSLDTSVKWIRLLYTHPAHYTDELIDTIRDEVKICKYLDLPIQHISDSVLRRMNRHTSRQDILRLIEKLRKQIHSLVLRTSIIVGFPGETEKDFRQLLDFLRQTRFERLGAFIYSKEQGTKASRLSGQVPEGLKKERFDAVMKLQQEVSSSLNRKFLGKVIDVLVDDREEDNSDVYIGRTQGDAPEVDGVVYVTGKGIKTGEFCKVRITDTLEYDLVGQVVKR